MKKSKIFYLLILIQAFSFACSKTENTKVDNNSKLWYQSPAQNWAEAFPLGNGRLAAMCFGGTKTERFQINEESLWAGCQTNPIAENFNENLKEIQKMVLSGNYAEAHDFGVKNLTATPTSFRSYEPFAELTIDFDKQNSISNYKRELDMFTGVCKVTYTVGDTEIIQESFISAVDDVLCIRLSSSGKEKLNCTIGLQRFKDANIIALSGGRLNMDGQIIDVEAPVAYDDNSGGSGPGGKHMRFAGRLSSKTSEGKIIESSNSLQIEGAKDIILLFTAATDYNLSILNFDPSVNPGKKAERILGKAEGKTWKQLKNAHIKEHSEMFERVSLDLGTSSNDTLPTDKRLEAFHNGAEDNGLIVQLFLFGRYLLMNSSRTPAILPANLQGKWNEKTWAPWEADYHLNVNLQMNYWPADATNLPETFDPLINWFEQLTKFSKPFAKEMYHSDGWFSCLATNPFGRVTPSASTPESQFINGVLDPLAGAWMVMNLWDHYEYSQDQVYLREKLFPLLKGASEFILDVLVTDSKGNLHFVPSASPENSYIDPTTGKKIRITSTSTYHLSVIRAVFEATLEAANILNAQDIVCERVIEAEKLLPEFPVGENGRLMEWQQQLEETEPGHRHLSSLLGVHPFALINEDTPELFEATRKSLDWRKENGQGSGGGWSGAHSSIMYSWLQDGEKAYDGLETIAKSLKGTLLNAHNIFQIDANFGATSVVTEMLIQSHLKDAQGNFIIHLLPAVPSKWSTGSVKGLCARGGFIVDLDWGDGKIKSAFISSKKGGTCKVRFQDKTIDLTLKAGEKKKLTEL
ncbi:glycoside hydrolase family 95 protein [Draconibacterium sp.]